MCTVPYKLLTESIAAMPNSLKLFVDVETVVSSVKGDK